MDDSLSVIPLLEVVALEFLMGWMQLLEIDHFVDELSLCKTLID
jgi:hypothetical protein